MQAAEARINFPGSVSSLSARLSATKREVPTADDAQSMEFGVALRLRNYADMQARIARGEIISRAELERTYLPLPGDYAAVVAWLKSQGFTITRDDPSRLVVYASGRLPQIRKGLQVHLVSVTANGGRVYHAADTAPSLPQSIAGPVLGINHLQPYHQRRKHAIAHSLTDNSPPYTVSQILKAYNAANLGVTGAGQKIAILIDTVPNVSDVTTFWTNNGIAQSASNLEFINVNNVDDATLHTATGEETLDVEWASGIAPGAGIRVYAAGSLANSDLDKAIQQIINDLPTQPALHTLSISLGEGETAMPKGEFDTDAQLFATLASSGVSVFVSTGDYGSTPNNPSSTVAPANNGPLQVESYASDPSVTAVGGTSLYVDATTGLRASESAWGGVGSPYGGGGGVSIQYARPSWQQGTGVPSGTMRCLPDVALVADPNTGAYVYLNGGVQVYGGTSWGTPVWAGFCALINQARANQGWAPLGLMNPRLYPLLGTSSFTDITTGSNATSVSNGLYQATVGYDMATGLGAPNMGVLLPALVAVQPPQITSFSPASGPIYSTLLVNGTNLGNTSAVTLNGVPVSFTVSSDSRLVIPISPGTGGGVIAVTTPSGTTTSSSAFTVTATPVSSIVISQVYCEGGSNYQNDFIELFNAGTTSVNLSTWSVQMTGATGRSWTVVPLSGTLAPAHHYLVGGRNFGGAGAPLPTPDVQGSFSLDPNAGGKIALVSTQTRLTVSSPSGSTIKDFVGYGSANAHEGAGAAPLTINNFSNFRVSDGRSDTNNNNADFVVAWANPRNSASATSPAAWPDVTLTSAHSGSFTQADPAQPYTITVTNAGTASTGGTVTVTDTLPTGLTATSFSGTGWTTNLATLTATRSDTLAAGSSYPTLTLTVSVAANAATSLTNTAQVTASGDLNSANNSATDPTTILAMTPSQSWRYLYFGSTANTGAGADTAIASADGLPNLLKYALGLNPLVPTTTASVITEDATTGYLRLTVTKNPAATDVTFSIVGTTNLANAASWSASGVVVDQNTASTLRAHSGTPVSSGSSFLRLVVTRP